MHHVTLRTNWVANDHIHIFFERQQQRNLPKKKTEQILDILKVQ
jgi:hypothetical protein